MSEQYARDSAANTGVKLLSMALKFIIKNLLTTASHWINKFLSCMYFILQKMVILIINNQI